MHDNICEPYQGPCRVDKRGEGQHGLWSCPCDITALMIRMARFIAFSSGNIIYLIVRDEMDASTLWTKKWLRKEPINKAKSRLGLYTYLSSVTDKIVIFCFINW